MANCFHSGGDLSVSVCRFFTDSTTVLQSLLFFPLVVSLQANNNPPVVASPLESVVRLVTIALFPNISFPSEPLADWEHLQ